MLKLDTLVYYLLELVYCVPNNAVVIWCDRVGGLQLRSDPLPWNGPDLLSGSTQRGQEIGSSPECCLFYRDASTVLIC